MQGMILTFFAVPNGGTRNPVEMKNLKAEGLKVGASDIVVIGFDKVIFIELKRESKKAKPSKEQIDFIDTVNKSKACIGAVCYGYEEAKKFILSHL